MNFSRTFSTTLFRLRRNGEFVRRYGELAQKSLRTFSTSFFKNHFELSQRLFYSHSTNQNGCLSRFWLLGKLKFIYPLENLMSFNKNITSAHETNFCLALWSAKAKSLPKNVCHTCFWLLGKLKLINPLENIMNLKKNITSALEKNFCLTLWAAKEKSSPKNACKNCF